ncbi:MAG TPA: asparagine synthase (glutamine-hydrolyzing) [Reyranella sp.]|nr:asparagine synthase (glutamine-hydrolyzing) [Reyranella sp.]
MCGIFGSLAPGPLPPASIAKIHELQRHRGPDDKRSWVGKFKDLCLTLAFERLAIIDLRPEASQPFHSAQGSVLVYNGEIYNYVELRKELEAAGVAFRTSSDTEVLVNVLDAYGIKGALARLNGMFAFAWLCGKTGRLWLARDRVGEKPLYYHLRGPSQLTFGSEIKALIGISPSGAFSPNYRVIHNFLVNGVVDDTDDTFFREIKSLRPGQYAEVHFQSGALEVRTHDYWPSSSRIVESNYSLNDSVDLIRSLLSDAVRIRLRSDVPLGFLVSGGLDSSIVTALSLQHGIDRERLSAFSVVNPNVPADETRWIDSITGHLGISVNKVVFNPSGQALLEMIDKHVYFHDEPFSGLSVVAHAELMKAANQHGKTVLLSGQGGDELFCGYRKYVYFAIQQLWRQRQIGEIASLVWPFLRNDTLVRQFSAPDAARYTRLRLPGVPGIPLGKELQELPRTNIGLQTGMVSDRQLADLLRFSTPAITHAEDRASMAFSREVRFPYFDFRLMEAAISLPLKHKLAEGWTKKVLRLVGQPLLPSEIAWRKDKTGHFSATADWLVRSAGPIAKQRLDEESPVFRFGLLDARKLLPRWKAFWSGQRSELAVRHIVSIFTLDSWLRTFATAFR